jgi:transposase
MGVVMGGKPLCPSPEVWQLSLIALLHDRILIHLEPLRESVPCPHCGTRSNRIHSRYWRRPWDLSWSSWPVQLVVHARKFFCDNAPCLRRIFTEPFPGVLGRYARQTQRLHKVLLELAFSSCAEAAARVSKLLGYITSPDPLIRYQRREHRTAPMPQVLGVDEFALCRGSTYGTILIDLERHQPVDILDGKQAEPLAQWLRDHPGVDTLVRDRAEAYALAGHTGAPQALQVADRFHLARNVSDALTELLRSRRWTIPAQETELAVHPELHRAKSAAILEMKEPKATPRKEALWEAVQQRKGRGEYIRAMARELGVCRRTVRKYLAAEHPPAYRKRSSRRTKLAPYLSYMHQRWQEGCRSARQLYGELVSRGYRGSESQVRATVRPWRSRRPSTPHANRRTTGLHWWVLRPNQHLRGSSKQELADFLEANPALAKGYYLKESFQRILAEHDGGAFDAWLQAATESGLKPFEALAKSFRQDYAAIKLALTMPWSTGQCEGQICRVKLIKRLGYGRAKLDLLRQRVLHRCAA